MYESADPSTNIEPDNPQNIMSTSQSLPTQPIEESPYEDIMDHHPQSRTTGQTWHTYENAAGTAVAWDNSVGQTGLALEAIESSYEGLGERPVDVPTVYDRVGHEKL